PNRLVRYLSAAARFQTPERTLLALAIARIPGVAGAGPATDATRRARGLGVRPALTLPVTAVWSVTVRFRVVAARPPDLAWETVGVTAVRVGEPARIVALLRTVSDAVATVGKDAVAPTGIRDGVGVGGTRIALLVPIEYAVPAEERE